MGNGGSVVVHSQYLYQSGQIFANGKNGGMVQFNVNGMTMAPGAVIEAKGLEGTGGKVVVNSGGVVDMQSNAGQAAVVDTSGKVIGTVDTNLISIKGSLINMDGILRADGITVGGVASKGGSVLLVATAQGDCNNCDLQSPAAKQLGMDTLSERNNTLIANNQGDIVIGEKGQVSANGSGGAATGDGGFVVMAAADDIVNAGKVTANGGDGADGATPVAGGNGGGISLTAGDQIVNSGTLQANGGKGGVNTNDVSATDENNGEDETVTDGTQTTSETTTTQEGTQTTTQEGTETTSQTGTQTTTQEGTRTTTQEGTQTTTQESTQTTTTTVTTTTTTTTTPPATVTIGSFNFDNSVSVSNSDFGTNASVNPQQVRQGTFTPSATTFNASGYGNVTFDTPVITVKVSTQGNLDPKLEIFQGTTANGQAIFTQTYNPNLAQNNATATITGSFQFQTQLKDAGGNPILGANNQPITVTLSRNFSLEVSRNGASTTNFKGAVFNLLTSGSGNGTVVTIPGTTNTSTATNTQGPTTVTNLGNTSTGPIVWGEENRMGINWGSETQQTNWGAETQQTNWGTETTGPVVWGAETPGQTVQTGSQTLTHTENATNVDLSGQQQYAGANGGSGGLISFSYGGGLSNTGTVSANGGNGGKGAAASATDTDIADNASGHVAAYAEANATGGDGGSGGTGGLVVFSGPANPTNTGLVQANGGNGGSGGNASANATAEAFDAEDTSSTVEGSYGQPVLLADGTYGDPTKTMDNDYGAPVTTVDNEYGDKVRTENNDYGAPVLTGSSPLGTPVLTNNGASSTTTVTNSSTVGNTTTTTTVQTTTDTDTYAATGENCYTRSQTDEYTRSQTDTVARNQTDILSRSQTDTLSQSKTDVTTATTYNTNATAIANANNGSNGAGGSGGTIVVQNTGSANTATFDTKAGDSTFSGTLSANASAINGDGTTGAEVENATATGNTFGVDTNNFDTTQANELLSSGGNLILLSQNGNTFESLSDRVNNASVRSVNGSGFDGSTTNNLVIGDTSGVKLTLDQTGSTELGGLTGLQSMTVVNASGVNVPTSWSVGKAGDGSSAGGQLAIVSNGNIEVGTGGGLTTYGDLSGGSVVLATTKDLVNQGAIGNGGGLFASNLFGGSTILKAGRDIINLNQNMLNLEGLFFNQGYIASNGSLLGGTIRMNAKRNILNLGTVEANATSIASDAVKVVTTSIDVGFSNESSNNDLHDINPGVTKTFTIPGGTISTGSGDVTVPTMTANATYNADGTVTLVFKQGDNTIQTFTLNSNGTQHLQLSFTASQPGGNVTVTRDFHVNYSTPQRGARANVNLLMKKEGSFDKTFTLALNSTPTGGEIISKAGDLNANLGIMRANAGLPFFGESPALALAVDNLPMGFKGQGGSILMYGGDVAANLDIAGLPLGPEGPSIAPGTLGVIEANGMSQGGQVTMAAGGKDGGDGLTTVSVGDGTFNLINDLLGGNPLTDGFGVQVMTPPLTTLLNKVNLGIGGSVLQFGTVNTLDYSGAGGSVPGTDGTITLAGNGQVGIGPNAGFNRTYLDYTNILNSLDPTAALHANMAPALANGGNIYLFAGNPVPGTGMSAVELALCSAGAVMPAGFNFTPNFQLPARVLPPPPTGVTPTTTISADSLGLYQERRPANRDMQSSDLPSILISMGQGRMFMARTYRSVTQEILALALREYNRQLAIGRPTGVALDETRELLERAGVDAEVAAQLLQQIKNGTLQADDLVVKVLQQISSTQTQPSQELTQ